MNIYGLRDRLLDYWLTPFAAPDDKTVLASIAATVNNYAGADTNAISQAPHHFEIHRLAKVTEAGRIIEDREFLCEASSLIRPGIRQRLDTTATQEPATETTSAANPFDAATKALAGKLRPQGTTETGGNPPSQVHQGPG